MDLPQVIIGNLGVRIILIIWEPNVFEGWDPPSAAVVIGLDAA